MTYDLLRDSMEDFGLEWRCRAVFDGDFIPPHDPNRRIANDVEIAVSAFYSKKTEPSMKVSKLIAWAPLAGSNPIREMAVIYNRKNSSAALIQR